MFREKRFRSGLGRQRTGVVCLFSLGLWSVRVWEAVCWIFSEPFTRRPRSLSITWARPMYSARNRVINRNDSHLIGEKLRFGPACLLESLVCIIYVRNESGKATCQSHNRLVGLIYSCSAWVEIDWSLYTQSENTRWLASRANGPAGLLGWPSSRWA